MPEYSKLSDKELEKLFMKEFPQFANDKSRDITIRLSFINMWAVMTAIQLASKHPDVKNSNVIKLATGIGKFMEKQLSVTPVMQEVIKRGWFMDLKRDNDREHIQFFNWIEKQKALYFKDREKDRGESDAIDWIAHEIYKHNLI